MILIIWALSWENRLFAYAKTKTQISFAVTAKLISAFVFATRIGQYLYFLDAKFQASSHLVWLYSLVCVGPGRRHVFSQQGSYYLPCISQLLSCLTEQAAIWSWSCKLRYAWALNHRQTGDQGWWPCPHTAHVPARLKPENDKAMHCY